MITLFLTDYSLDRSKTALDKSVMDGTGESAMLPGMNSGSLSMNGHVDQANLNLLEISYAKDVPVTFLLKIVEGLTADASYAGSLSISSFQVGTNFDGNWAFSLSGDTSGAVVYSASAP